MQARRRPEVPRWFVLLGAVPLVAGLVSAAVSRGDPVAALGAAFGAQGVAGRVAEMSLTRRHVHQRRAEALAQQAVEPRWLRAPFAAGAVWAVVDLVGRVQADPRDWWSWGLLGVVVLAIAAAGVSAARWAVRWFREWWGRSHRPGNGGAGARRSGARVA